MTGYRSENQDPGQRRRVRFIIVPIIALVILLSLLLVKKLFLDRPSVFTHGEKTFEGPYRVLYVYDGDTFQIKRKGKETKVRMIGIDAPESVASEEYGKPNTKEGKNTAEYVKKLIYDKNVYLEFDQETEDQYGRLLAYVYLSDETTMVEEILLSEGYVQVMTIRPNTRYAERFLEIQNKARNDGKGYWGTGYFK